MEYALYRFFSKLLAIIGMSNEHIPLERHSIGQVTVYDVTEDELERMEITAGDVGLDFPICLGCLTSAISIFATLEASQSAPSSGKTVCIVLIPVLLIIGVIFGFRWFASRGRFTRIIAKIRTRQIGPLGDEKRELKRGELESLPLVPTPATGMADSVSVKVEEAPLQGEQK